MEKLSKNMTWMAASNAVSSLFGIALFIYLARVLMPDALGRLSYAFSIVFFLANFIDLGLSTYGTREIARQNSLVTRYVSEIVSFRIMLAALIAMLMLIAVLLYGHSFMESAVIVESLLMLWVFAAATEWAFQGIEKMNMVFVSFAAASILQLGLCLLFVKGSDNLLRVPLIYALAAMPVPLIFLRVLKFRFIFDRSLFRNIAAHLSSATVIWAISLFVQIYNGLDIFIVGLFRPPDEIAYFSVSRRFVGGIGMLLIFLANALLPRLSASLAEEGREQFDRAVSKFLKFAAAFSFFVFLPLIYYSKEILRFFLGESYIPAAMPLKIMLFGLLFVLFNIPYSTALVAMRREVSVLKQAFFCAVSALILYFMLIPRHGLAGAAWSFVVVEIIAFVWIIAVYKKMVRIG